MHLQDVMRLNCTFDSEHDDSQPGCVEQHQWAWSLKVSIRCRYSSSHIASHGIGCLESFFLKHCVTAWNT